MQAIDYYYSVRSSFAYLGAARIAAMARRHGRMLIHKPILLADTLPPIGAQRFEERPPLRMAYMRRDLERCAAHLDIALLPEPVHHYGPTELPSGLVIAAQRAERAGEPGDVDTLSEGLLAALWRDDRNIADETVIADVCRAAGFNPAPLIAAALTDDVQLELSRNNREAIIRGVMGSPTYFVDGENFFGQDRLDFVERALAV